MRSPGLAHAIDSLRRYVDEASEPDSKEARNLLDSVKYFVQHYGDWDGKLYATMLLHDVLDASSKNLIEFKYLSAEERMDLEKEFDSSASRLAKTLNALFKDWGGSKRLNQIRDQKHESSFPGLGSHVVEQQRKRSAKVSVLVRTANQADAQGRPSLADSIDRLIDAEVL